MVIAAGAVAVCAVALLAVRGGSSSALADAAGKMEGENMRVKFLMGFTDSDGAYSVSGEGVTSADGSRAEMDMTVGLEKEEEIDMVVRQVGDRYWFRSPRFRRIMPAGKRWVYSVDPSTAPSTLTPSEWAEFLAGADDVDEVSDSERVDGELTTHYSGMVDIEELADEIGGETKKRIEAAVEQLDREPGQKVGLPVEAWISRNGLPKRMRMYAEGSESFDVTVDVLGYGVPVDVEPPPERTVISEAEFDRLTSG